LPLLEEVDKGHAGIYEPQRALMHWVDGDEHAAAAADPTNAEPQIELRDEPISWPPTPTSI
jgi:hypothetical protein